MRRAQTLIVVFAKAPQAGRVKTRLAPRLGAAGAARLHMRLLRRALATAQAARCGPVELHLAAGSPALHMGRQRMPGCVRWGAARVWCCARSMAPTWACACSLPSRVACACTAA